MHLMRTTTAAIAAAGMLALAACGADEPAPTAATSTAAEGPASSAAPVTSAAPAPEPTTAGDVSSAPTAEPTAEETETLAATKTPTPSRAAGGLDPNDPWTPGACTEPAGLPTTTDRVLMARYALAAAAAKKKGLNLTITSAQRDWDEQEAVYARAVKTYGTPAKARRWALPPQESTHVMGLALDLGNEVAARWLDKEGWRYGLCQAYANEWWHFEKGPGVGVACPAPIPSAASLPKKPCP